MTYQNLLIEIGEDRVAEITLNRPEHLNTFTLDLAAELNRALVDLNADESVRVMIVKGAGRAFCAGIDVSDFGGKGVTFVFCALGWGPTNSWTYVISRRFMMFS